jgi:Flp pilus assembly protein TadD
MSEEERKRRTEQIRDLREAIRNLDQRRLREIGAKWKEANGDFATSGSKMRSVQDAEQRLTEMEASLKDPDPSPPGVTLALGTALFQTGAIAEAEAAFRAVLARDPQSGDAHHNLALVCTVTDRLDEAEREMTAAEKTGVPVNPRLKQELERRRLARPR